MHMTDLEQLHARLATLVEEHTLTVRQIANLDAERARLVALTYQQQGAYTEVAALLGSLTVAEEPGTPALHRVPDQEKDAQGETTPIQ